MRDRSIENALRLRDVAMAPILPELEFPELEQQRSILAEVNGRLESGVPLSDDERAALRGKLDRMRELNDRVDGRVRRGLAR